MFTRDNVNAYAIFLRRSREKLYALKVLFLSFHSYGKEKAKSRKEAQEHEEAQEFAPSIVFSRHSKAPTEVGAFLC